MTRSRPTTALTQVEAIDRLDIVELEPAIRRASEKFHDYNHHVLEDPRMPLMGDPGVCHVRTLAGRFDAVPVFDVSVVGVALSFPNDERPPAIGTTLARCHLRLVPHRLVPCDLVVHRHHRAPEATRVGCRILPLSLAAEQCLQRIIMDIELRRAG